jgi:tetratricopeptide (TPR) repeat protein
MSQATEQLFDQPARMIGRMREIEAIKVALNPPLYDQVFYLDGAGGIGKTRLLLEIDAIARATPNTVSTGIIDLYHGHYHQSIFLMDAIAERLHAGMQPTGDRTGIFTRYDEAARQYRLEGATGEARQRQQLDQAFIDDYREIAQQQPIVLLIDTFEKLHPIIEEAEQFNFRPASRLESWLVDMISRLPNTLTVLAGRPRPKQRALLQERLGERLTVLRIAPFSEQETSAYVDHSGVVLPEDIDQPELYKILHNASDGRPVILALALASAKLMGFDTAALPPSFKDPYPANSAIFVKLLVNDLNHLRPDLARLLMQTFYLRKGLNTTLLHRIGWIDEDETNQIILDEFRNLPFVKVTGDDLITLHDEAYEFLFGKLAATEETKLYRAAIADLTQQLDRLNAAAGEPSYASTQKRQMLQIERLFYQLSLNPLVGCQRYRELCYSAIRANDEDFDTQLQDELARFFERGTSWGDHYRHEMQRLGSTWAQIVFDEGVRWVHRRVERHIPGQTGSRYLAAIAIADRIAQTYPEIYAQDALARCALDNARLNAETYESPRTNSEILQEYALVTQQLEQILAESSNTSHDDSARLIRRYALVVLAWAYNRWGYYERKLQHLNSAITKYKHAVRLLKQHGGRSNIERAITLNNLGFALAQQGQLERGLHFVQAAAQLALAEGSMHRYAICLNTMAQIKNELNQSGDALIDVLQARRILEEVKSQRNLALNAKAEGDVRRWLAYRNRADWQRSQGEYEQAIARYQYALQLFDSPEISERLRRIEVRQALGCAYRSRGKVLFDAGRDCSADMAMALGYLQDALDIAQQQAGTPIISDLLEDIAVIYVNQDNFTEAATWLQQAATYIPDSFRIVEGEGLRKTEETLEQSVYWLRLGQIELQYAISAIASRQLQAGCRLLLCAYAYIHAFSPQAPQLNALRAIGKNILVRFADDAQTLEHLRAEAYWEAQKLRIEDAFSEVDQIFDQAIEDIQLL